MENVLKARITADISDYKAKMVQAEVVTEDFEKGIEKTQTAVAELDKILAVLIREIASLNTENSKSKVQIQNLTDELNKEKLAIAAVTAELNKLKAAPTTPPKALGILEQLNQKAMQLKKSIEQGTNLLSIARLNKELEVTQTKISRIQALGRSAGTAANQVGKLTNGVGAANSVAIEFNRVIQDSPFGLIGIGNNLQQLAGNFANVRASAGSTGKAVAMSLSALISPVNLALLAVSALTAGFTAYQMGAFDGIFDIKDLSKSLDEFREKLGAVDSARLQGLNNADKELVTLNSLKSIIESETSSRDEKLGAIKRLQESYPSYFGNLTKEQILAGNLTKTYEALTKTILARAQAEASVSKFVELAEEERLILEKTNKERARIGDFEAKVLQNRISGQKELETINQNQVNFLRNEIAPEQERLNEIEKEKARLVNDGTESLKLTSVELLNQNTTSGKTVDYLKVGYEKWLQIEKATMAAVQAARFYEDAIARAAGGLTGNEGVDPMTKTQNDIAKSLAGMGAPVDEIAPSIDSAKMKMDELDMKARNLQESFSVLGSVITSAFAGNPGLGQFVSSLAKFAGEIIARNFAIAKSNVIVGATAGGVAAGPAAPFVTPTLIASGLAVLLTAFKGLIGGSSSSSQSGGSSQTYSNVGGRREFGGSVIAGKPYIVGEKRPELFVPSSNGIIMPRIPTMGSNGMGSNGAGTNRIIVQVEGVIANDVIRIQNKKSIEKVSRT